MPSKDFSEYAPAEWAFNTYDLDIPSGGKCLLRKVDPLQLSEAGLMDKLDFATSVVMDTHVKNANLSNVERVKRDRAKREARGKGLSEEEAVAELEDKQSMRNVMKSAENSKAFREVMDQLIVLAVVAPKMHLPPEDPDEERNDEWFYTDAVPFHDKMAVFNKVMEGVRAVQQFREESESAVGDVAHDAGVQPAAKRAPRPRAKRSAS
jgi:hypothetical protein